MKRLEIVTPIKARKVNNAGFEGFRSIKETIATGRVRPNANSIPEMTETMYPMSSRLEYADWTRELL